MVYIHGSGGSYKQARSIGSVLYQKMKKDKRFDFHFNTFTGMVHTTLFGVNYNAFFVHTNI